MENPSSPTKRHRLKEKGAFDQVVPPSALASPPSSSTQSKLRWNVFINHRGRDVKATLATAIYNKLSGMGEQVFLDQKALEPGGCIPMEIQEAMNDASLHVAIFSKMYADSPWCLAELSHMLTTGVKIIPIFYHVKPSELRWDDEGKGLYAGSFAKHKSRYTGAKVGEWKEALQTVSYRSGYELNNEDWGWVLEGLANWVVMERSKAKVAVPTDALGLEERVGKIEKIIQGGKSVHIVGIWGKGGCGKTTLAKEFFNWKLPSFSKWSFFYDVRDRASKNQLSGLQKELLENLGVKDPQFQTIHQGKDLLAKHLRSLRALVVLDNVDHTEQMNFLLPATDMLSGSIIIITTRCKEVLTSWCISESSIYEMKGLSECHAKKLFCSYAFQTSDAPSEFECLVKRALKSCQGLPLSLKVFGGQLCFKHMDYWESQLNEISRVLPEEILKSLKISYDALDPVEQERFLDVACFFNGEIKSFVLQLWDGLGRREGLYSWETLQNRCLVELDEKNRVRMHDHLRDLGREIANEKLPYRIWYKDQINSIQTQAKVRGIIEVTTSSSRMDYWSGSPPWSRYYPQLFEECVEVMGNSNPELKYLVFNYQHFNAKIGELSRDLVWLRCFNFNHANLSSCLSLRRLRVLELYGVERLETIWENEGDAPLQLRELIIGGDRRSQGLKFRGFPPSIGGLKDLKKIVIYNVGNSMTSLPDEFYDLNSLEYLELSYCSLCFELSLPIRFGNLRNLWHLKLSGCQTIRTLPNSFGNLFSLRELEIKCKGLISLPDTFGHLSSLRKFSISCPDLKSLPATVGRLNALEELDMLYTGVESLPETFGQLANLCKLKINDCPIRELAFGPGSKASLNKLREIRVDGTHLSTISISEDCCPSLETLTLFSNKCPTGIETLPKTLKRLDLNSSPLVGALGFVHLTGLEYLKTDCLFEMPMIQSLEQMQRLKTVELTANSFGALEPCIRTIKNLPSEMKVQARVSEMHVWEKVVAMDGVESIVNGFPSGKLGIIHSFTEADEWRLPRLQMQSSHAAIVCFVFEQRGYWITIEDEDKHRVSIIWFKDTYDCASTQERSKRWVWISVCDFQLSQTGTE